MHSSFIQSRYRKTGQIDKSNKLSKYEAVERLRVKMQKHEESHCTSDDLLTKNEVAGFFITFLKESKFKFVKHNNVEKEEDDNVDDEEDEATFIDHETNHA